MDPVLHIRSSSSEPLDLDSEDLQLRVDFFRKLGYSSTDVKAALRKLGLGTDTNSVLGELVQSRIGTPPCHSEGDEKSTGPKDPLLPPSWVQGPSRMTPQLGDRKNADMELRPIVIDGSNVAISHGNKEVFSCRGIQLAVNFFLDRGHSAITVFVPTWRKEQPRPDAPITDQHILMELEKRKIVVFTPSRRVGGKRVVCYDDRFIVKLAHEYEGVIVSNDTYRDLQGERPEWKKCIEERLLMYSFVNDKFMPPDDPLGRHGPSLDNFLRKKPLPTEQKRQLCPYDKKCTYGIKCKFYHPERANQSYRSLADELREKAQISTGKEEKGSKLQARPYQSDPGPARSACPHPEDSKTEYFKEQGFSHPGQVSENTLLYWDDSRNSPVPVPCPATGNSYQKEWPVLSSAHSYYYTNLDSGFGSYENHYSDYSHYLNNSHMLLPQQPSAFSGSRHGPAHVEKNKASEPCRCCSQVLPRTTQQNHRSLDSKDQPKYDTYPPHMIPPHQHSHPSYGEAPHHPKYWSDPFQGLPLAGMTCCLPSPADTSHSSSCSYKGHQYHPWGQQQQQQQQQQSSSAAFDPKRSELRKKLQAIFNPQQVDTVMEMYPRLMDAEKLAAEILNLKAQRGIF